MDFPYCQMFFLFLLLPCLASAFFVSPSPFPPGLFWSDLSSRYGNVSMLSRRVPVAPEQLQVSGLHSSPRRPEHPLMLKLKQDTRRQMDLSLLPCIISKICILYSIQFTPRDCFGHKTALAELNFKQVDITVGGKGYVLLRLVWEQHLTAGMIWGQCFLNLYWIKHPANIFIGRTARLHTMGYPGKKHMYLH